MFLISWFISGFVFYLFAVYFVLKNITIKDIFTAIMFGVFGFFTVLVVLISFFFILFSTMLEKYGNKNIIGDKNDK